MLRRAHCITRAKHGVRHIAKCLWLTSIIMLDHKGHSVIIYFDSCAEIGQDLDGREKSTFDGIENQKVQNHIHLPWQVMSMTFH